MNLQPHPIYLYDDHAVVELFLRALEDEGKYNYYLSRDKMLKRHSEIKKSRGLSYI